MYAQFFGNYLLSKKAVTKEELVKAIQKRSSERIKLGTLAMHAGHMTASEVDHIIILQTHNDKRFGELAIKEGFLSESQVTALLKSQTPDYLLLGQILVDNGILTNTDFENLMVDYQSENEIYDLDIASEQREKVNQLIQNCFLMTERQLPDYCIDYLNLLFNNLVRFIGEDFTPLNPCICSEYPVNYCVSQDITGKYKITSYLDMTEDVAIEFASRYVGDTCTSFDEYVKASMEDFINLHNGLYNVNMSNDESIELGLNPPVVIESATISDVEELFLLPIIFPFGTINFMFHMNLDK